MRKLPDEGQIKPSIWCVCPIKIMLGRPIANALGYRNLFQSSLSGEGHAIQISYVTGERCEKKNFLVARKRRFRNLAFSWQRLFMKATRGEVDKMSVSFRQNWVITHFRSCGGIFKTIVVAFGTLVPRQNLIIKLTVWWLVFHWSRRTDGILAATWAYIFLCLKAVKIRKHAKKWHLKSHLFLTLLIQITTTLLLNLFMTCKSIKKSHDGSKLIFSL